MNLSTILLLSAGGLFAYQMWKSSKAIDAPVIPSAPSIPPKNTDSNFSIGGNPATWTPPASPFDPLNPWAFNSRKMQR